MSRLFEVCCGSIDDAILAEKAGGDRIELCASMFFGGLTPTIGTVIEAKKRLGIPVIVMIRPRGGGFCYTEAEYASMLEDAKALIEAGADGLVFGILKPDGSLDLERMKPLVEICGDKESVCHRCFDVVPDPRAALEELIDLRATRLLTSGQEDQTILGIDLLVELVQQAGDRIEIMPGGGIHLKQVNTILNTLGVNQIHLASFTQANDNSTQGRPHVTFGGALFPPENRYEIANLERLTQMTDVVKNS
jgi:copper homeostasis protein